MSEQTYGVAALGHDAAVAVVEGDQILFAAHSERYTREKSDPFLTEEIFMDALDFADPPKLISWYEKPFKKKLRQIRAGQFWDAIGGESPKEHISSCMDLEGVKLVYQDHHLSHAAGGYFTSPFEDATIVVLDAIGEFATGSIWSATGSDLTQVWSLRYPQSLGLLYSAFTQRCGFIPNDEEYILMGLAALGDPQKYRKLIHDELFEPIIRAPFGPLFRFKKNFHRGIMDWHPEIIDVENLAAAIQLIMEESITRIVGLAKHKNSSKNLVLSGGVALNCVANAVIARAGRFDNIWIMPNPGDAGSALGAALAVNRRHVEWKGPYLGTNINRPYDRRGMLDALQRGEVIGVANGRAEYGPRALGNRSLLADPRGRHMQERVNQIKQREQFRPFAPAILAEHVDEFFDMPYRDSPYMQYTARCRRPDLYPAICHVDGTSRIQTVTRQDNNKFYLLLRDWYKRTGCPMLLNTSLNVKGEPLVNSWLDARDFHAHYGIEIF